jgi:probable HAF family extracellular repeat protein
MNPKKLTITIAVVLGVVLAGQVPLSAQERAKHHHYKLVDLGSTFGGPQSYFVSGSGDAYSSIMSSEGIVAGFADTSEPDPFPNICFWDCNVVHAFQAGSGGHLTDLGALPGGGSSVPIWISANRLIAGVSENGETDPLYAGLPQERAVLWQQGKIINLGTLPEGGYQSEANSVNSAGQVVGAALNTIPDANSMQSGTFWLWGGITPPYQYQTRAFLWEKKRGMQDLGTLPGGTDAQAIFINEGGQVVGFSYTSSAPSTFCGAFTSATGSFIWDREGGMKDLGSLGGSCTLATDFNDQGQVVGSSNLAGDQSVHAFLWEHGSIQDLGGSLGGDFTGAFGLNAQGQAVGFAYLPEDTTFHGALWMHVGKLTDLGVVGNDPCSDAVAINANGQVVGDSSPVCDEFDDDARAFLWEDGSLFDLNTLIPLGSALYLRHTYTINDRGEIAGTGVDAGGNEHAFLAIPCDENHPGVAGCDYSLVDPAALVEVQPAHASKAPAASPAKLSPAEMMARIRALRAGRNRRYGTLQTLPQ